MLAKSLLALALVACSARGEPGEDRDVSLPDVPDDLLAVPDPLHAQRTLSLRDGTIVGASTTAPSASGAAAALVYRCRPDASGTYRWSVLLDAGLAPLGLGPARRMATLRPGALADLSGEVDAQAESPNEGSVPLYRYRSTRGLYVLRLATRGGLGPGDEGAACAAGAPDVRSELSADFYLVAVPAHDGGDPRPPRYR
jgi:hypothetical protein